MKTTLFILLAAAPAVAVDFDQDIRPLLQQCCVECHGEKKQKGELRLDAKIFAFKGGHNGLAIVAGDTTKSLLLQRIHSTNEDERMPPKGEPLSPAQIVLIEAWIQAGAAWPENAADEAAAVDKRLQHWSVQPLRAVKDASIDSLINAKLAEKNLAMSPAADRRTLIRRLSFDLVGLPPTPEQVEQFVKDADPKAYEKLVDELLRSAHHGERWARHWLDIAHYADTHGFERDQLRPNAWRYRDYVIESFNADKPYDQFIREQIAGDVIAPNEPDAVIATGFLAAGPWDYVGQVETKSDMLKRAARAGDLDDMVTQVITSTMGITVNCARCHDHKLDPVKQEEYYRLWAVFAGVRRGDREVDSLEAKRISGEKIRLTQELAAARAQIAKLAGDGLDLASMVGGGVKGRGINLRTGNLTNSKLGYHRDIQTNRLQRIEWPADVKDVERMVSWVFVPEGRNSVPVASKIEVKGLPATSGHTWDAIRNGPLNAQRNTKIRGVDYAEKEHSILGLHANSGITFDLVKIRQRSGLGIMHFTAALGFGADVSPAASRADFTVYVDAERKFQRLRMRKDEFAHLDIPIPATAKTLTLIATDGGDGIGSDLLFLGDARLVPEVEHSRLTAAEQEQLKQLRAQAVKLDASLKALPDPAKVYAVVTEAKPPVIQVQRRGNPEDLQQKVQPGAFAWAKHASMDFGTNAMPEGQRRRLLAEWITHPDNPLTRRVIANRFWHHHFGQGIVTTPSDFGLGGDKPSHPKLLDWLADEMLRSGWSLKHLHKLIVMSAAYQQQSISHNDNAGRIDAQNRLLWRQNPRRLDAESVHDAVLSVAGTLNPAMGGPGYRDFNFTEAYAPIYDYITPDKPELLRRSIYRFVVRTTPHQFMSALDCPDPANLTPARAQTTTSLQALTLSNNEFMLQQAANFVTRLENESDSRTAAIRRAFQLCLQREPNSEERKSATHLVAEQGLFALCRMLINTNEFVFID